jgi:diaminopimelate epimerase
MKFVKVHGTGNDFVLLELLGRERDWSALAVAMCDRHFGVGADGILLVLPSEHADVRMRMFNPDGSEAEMCGNGIRCVAKYSVERGLAALQDGILKIETAAGVLTAQVTSMGVPRFAPAEIPVAVEEEPPIKDLPLDVGRRSVMVTCVSMGNPHAVHFSSESVAGYLLEGIGPVVENHELFPNRVDFEVAHVLSRDLIEARVWERGAGPTLACGSGAAAIMVAARLHDLVGEKIDIRFPGGTLALEWDGQGEVYLSGPAVEVFEGEWLEGK